MRGQHVLHGGRTCWYRTRVERERTNRCSYANRSRAALRQRRSRLSGDPGGAGRPARRRPSPSLLSMTRPQVELLFWDGCPSHPQALEDLRAAMAALGLDPDAVEVREVDTDGAPSASASSAPRRSASTAPTSGPGRRALGAHLPRLPPARRPLLPRPTRPTCATRCERDDRGAPHDHDRHRRPPPALHLPDTDGAAASAARRPTRPRPSSSSPATTAPTRWRGTTARWRSRATTPTATCVLSVNSNDAERYPRDSFDAMRERVARRRRLAVPYLRDEDQRSPAPTAPRRRRTAS